MSADLDHCSLCHEAIVTGDDCRRIGTPEGPSWGHRECLLRSAMGGIGHLENHAHWCKEMGDPDGGRTFRQSALEVDAWVVDNGFRL